MKDVGLIIINIDNNVEPQKLHNVAKFIDEIEDISQDTEEVIYGNFPILFIGNEIPISIERYTNPYLHFTKNEDENLINYENEAGQSVSEVLEILSLRNIYLHSLSLQNNEDEFKERLESSYKVLELL